MNTLDKIKDLQRTVRNQKHEINSLIKSLNANNIAQKKLDKRLNVLESSLVD